ncbi:MAG: SUMF1/EgtB/PvdO family nonheme iron enzyme [Bdellovibrio sp.]|nr:SUMF1/EgtB/PvdO family nonheme iron enzyme [Bdellovibrio sp.]
MIIIIMIICFLPPAFACSPDMVDFDTFCIDRYEAPNQYGQRPFVAQTATDGEEWCQAHSKRLCRESEWLLACEGAEKRKHPYGSSYIPHACNDQKVWREPRWSLIQKFPLPIGQAEIARLNQVEASGNFVECSTPEGVYDLGGNVSEWVLRTEPHTTNHAHVMMGCYWSGCYAENRGKELSICRGTNAGHPGVRGQFRTYEAGFRCCKDK